MFSPLLFSLPGTMEQHLICNFEFLKFCRLTSSVELWLKGFYYTLDFFVKLFTSNDLKPTIEEALNGFSLLIGVSYQYSDQILKTSFQMINICSISTQR